MAERAFSIIGATVSGNHGAEAMLSVCVQRLRERHPGARFTVFSYYPARDAALVKDPAVTIADGRPLALALVHLPFALLAACAHAVGARWPDALLPPGVRQLRHSQALLDAQGISFDDGRAIVLPYKILSIWPAMLLGVPVVKLSQAMGPFTQRLTRAAARWLLPQCRKSFARGRITARALEELGIPRARWDVAADLAFAFQPGDGLARLHDDRVSLVEEGIRRERQDGTLVISLSPSAVVHARMARRGQDYLALLVQLVERCTRDGRHLLVVPNATRAGAGAGSRNNDLPLIATLKDRVASRLAPELQARVTWADFDLTFEGIRRLLAASDVLIASRFHAMVAGLSLGIPVLVIGWSHKYAEVLMDFGCEAYALDNATAPERASEVLERLIRHRAEVRDRIARALPAVVESARAQFALRELA